MTMYATSWRGMGMALIVLVAAHPAWGEQAAPREKSVGPGAARHPRGSLSPGRQGSGDRRQARRSGLVECPGHRPLSRLLGPATLDRAPRPGWSGMTSPCQCAVTSATSNVRKAGFLHCALVFAKQPYNYKGFGAVVRNPKFRL